MKTNLLINGPLQASSWGMGAQHPHGQQRHVNRNQIQRQAYGAARNIARDEQVRAPGACWYTEGYVLVTRSLKGGLSTPQTLLHRFNSLLGS